MKRIRSGGWLASAPVRLINDRATLTWNSDKAYLADLARRGLPVIPTELVDRPGLYRNLWNIQTGHAEIVED